jgi:hypothetical protein
LKKPVGEEKTLQLTQHIVHLRAKDIPKIKIFKTFEKSEVREVIFDTLKKNDDIQKNNKSKKEKISFNF